MRTCEKDYIVDWELAPPKGKLTLEAASRNFLYDYDNDPEESLEARETTFRSRSSDYRL